MELKEVDEKGRFGSDGRGNDKGDERMGMGMKGWKGCKGVKGIGMLKWGFWFFYLFIFN